MTFAEMAKPYVQEYGWPVFPVARGGSKAPLVKSHEPGRGGVHMATTDLDMIDDWSDRFPNCNIAVATGEKIGIVVLDVDAPEGIENLNRLFEAGLERFPEVPLAQSGGGGMHYYFSMPPEPLKNRAGLLDGKNWLSGLDIRTTGGSITAPPSVHKTGNLYRWLVKPDKWNHGGLVIPPPMPYWLRMKASAERHMPMPGRKSKAYEGPPSLKILEMEEGELSSAQPGTRNDALNRAAYVFGQFIASGQISEAEARSRLTSRAEGIGLTRHEINPTIDSGIRAGMQNPRERV